MIYHQPLMNNLSDRLNSTGDTETLLLVDPELFSELVLPAGMDAASVVNCILTIHGRAPLDHFDPNYMRKAIGVWSRRRKTIWEKLLKTTQFDYDPISNYDRKEEYQDTHTSADKKESTSSSKSEITNTNTNTAVSESGSAENSENLVSADNVAGYSPESKRTGNSSENSKSTTTDTGKNSGNGTVSGKDSTEHKEEIKHTAHLYGNIGVTTTQQMIDEERKIVNYSVEEAIADDYRERFCLDFY